MGQEVFGLSHGSYFIFLLFHLSVCYARYGVEDLKHALAALKVPKAAVRLQEATAPLAEVFPLETRDGRLEWLRAFANGMITRSVWRRGMLVQEGPALHERLKAVETLARIAGDLQTPDVQISTGDTLIITIPSNSREGTARGLPPPVALDAPDVVDVLAEPQ